MPSFVIIKKNRWLAAAPNVPYFVGELPSLTRMFGIPRGRETTKIEVC